MGNSGISISGGITQNGGLLLKWGGLKPSTNYDLRGLQVCLWKKRKCKKKWERDSVPKLHEHKGLTQYQKYVRIYVR